VARKYLPIIKAELVKSRVQIKAQLKTAQHSTVEHLSRNSLQAMMQFAAFMLCCVHTLADIVFAHESASATRGNHASAPK